MYLHHSYTIVKGSGHNFRRSSFEVSSWSSVADPQIAAEEPDPRQGPEKHRDPSLVFLCEKKP
jgi:hypothetical protein